MILVAVRGMLSRKLRTILTMIAVLLGVAMIAGTYMLTDTINHSFEQIFSQANRPLDAVISGKAAISSNYRLSPPLPAWLLPTVLHTPGVADAEGEIADTIQLVDRAGKQLGGIGGAPTLLFDWPKPAFRRQTLIGGHAPQGNELTVDEDTFRREHLHFGQRIGVVGQGPVQWFTLVGETRFGSVGSLGGATLVAMDLATAQRVTGKEGKYDQIAVKASPGISQDELVQRLRAHIPTTLRGSLQIKTAEQATADQTQSIGNALSFLTIALLAFGGIAIFVGAFIIFNTFSITVAQRVREFALLRTLGATQRQVLFTIVFEALAIGFVSSVVGLLTGVGIAKALNQLFITFGADLPNTGLVLQTRTIIVAVLVGVLVTLASSLLPAVRATRIAPVIALREGFQIPRGRFSRFGPYIAVGLVLLGIVLLLVGIFAAIPTVGQRLLVIGVGALLLFFGVALISPKLIQPLALVVSWPLERLTSITGHLARENAMRNPGRTAATAAALMIGLALVGFVTIFAAELRQTASDVISRDFAGTFVISNPEGLPIPSGVQQAVAHVPGVMVVSATKRDNARISGIGNEEVTGVQHRTFGLIYRFQWVHGSAVTLMRMGHHSALVDDTLAKSYHLTMGSELRITTPVGRHDTFTVSGIYKSTVLLDHVVIPYSTFTRDWDQPKDDEVFIAARSGHHLTALKQRIAQVLQARYPTAQVHSQQDVKNRANQSINQLLALIYVLLALSVLVSFFGIVNTLVLSVYERTREIGLLRVIGATRRQVRWMVRWEGVITTTIGALMGLMLGIVLALLITTGLSSQGIEYALPIGQLFLWVLFAALFGLVAAAFPARRAVKLDALEAIAYE
jgi:putative ABC transport system permease protein